MIEFITSDTNQAVHLIRMGCKYTIKAVGRKCYFHFESKANKEIEEFGKLRHDIYKEIFNTLNK